MSMIEPASRDPVEIEERVPLTKAQRRAFLEAQRRLCGCGCGAPLVDGEIIDEHVTPLWRGGTNALSNRALWTAECSAEKTAREATQRGKVKRIQRQANPETRRKSPRPLKGRGFDRDPLR